MDRAVLAALAKWPNVPAVFGWLRLTARGEWRLRGEPIGNAAIRACIGRNYAGDAHGRWFFQNGPQRVYVALDATPWVLRVERALVTHTGRRVTQLRQALQLDDGRVVLATELGTGIVDDRDTLALADALVDNRLDPARLNCTGPLLPLLPLLPATLAECAARYGFVREPTAP